MAPFNCNDRTVQIIAEVFDPDLMMPVALNDPSYFKANAGKNKA
jgi:hypothetical protein